VAPCSACYLNLAKTNHYMGVNRELGDRVNAALAAGDLHYTPGSVDVRHLLDVLVNDVGLDAIESCVTRPLSGLRVAPYVGCMVPRPDFDGRFSDPDYPDELDRLLGVLGAEVIDFPLKTHCCGGHMTQIGPGTAFELIRRLVQAADRYDADLMATLCPMCQTNLDAYQGEMSNHFKTSYRIPVVFFTQLMGLAFGFDPEEVGFGKELVSAADAIACIGRERESAGSRPSRPSKTALPRPARGLERRQS
jgi:heterodisulfide reductase subunit B